ncbi:NAD(P)-binding protein [Actinomadura rupiterrae]|uniref:NAD(P)-binding protein n=1 Tax=Actinomadura rupiterrae TaxID=559627 RepID=UPI0020A57CA6|nr:NAD(P)-binding protein [Actinomadura rupiterrae]MCP2336945.1 phytoene dehydrogenase-like protein [Actinomadura rupiterrae]
MTTNSTTITIVGGGLGGLTAAIACAEAGASVVLHEAHRSLGGRGRATSPAPYVVHDGAHVFYADGPHYRWLAKRGLVKGLGWPSPLGFSRVRFRVDGRLRLAPPVSVLRAQSHRWLKAPVDEDFHSWASGRWDERTARQMASMIGVATYDADTGRLSAAFVWDLFQRVYGPRMPGVRWVKGGWQTVLDRMVQRARELGVRIETSSRVDALPEDGPVIVATQLASAARLLGEDNLSWTSGHCALLDIAVRADAKDRNLVFDLDEGAFHESYTMQDDSVAPRGESLYQLQMPVRRNEKHAETHRRLRAFADQVLPGWGDRVTFERTAIAKGRMGALDLPGQTWRDRPAIDRGNGVYLVGDMVAAPGMRGEITINSAITAAHQALGAATHERKVRT